MNNNLLLFFQQYSRINITLIDQVLLSVVNFLTGVFIARYLGLDSFGLFTLLWAITSFIGGVHFALICAPLLHLAPQQSTKTSLHYYTASIWQHLSFLVITTCLLSIIFYGIAYFYPASIIHHYALPITGVSLLYLTGEFIRRSYFVKNTPYYALLHDAITYIGQLICLFLVFQLPDVTISLAFVAIAIAHSAAIIINRHVIYPDSWNPEKFYHFSKQNWHFSKWLLGSTLVDKLSDSIFRVVISSVLGLTALGVIRACQNLLSITHILLLGLKNIVPPQAAHHYQNQGYNALLSYLRTVSIKGGILMFLLTFILAAIPEFWLHLFYGQFLVPYAYVLVWFAVIYFSSFFIFPVCTALSVVRVTRPIFNALFLANAVSLLFLYPLTKSLGYHGVMFAFLVTNIIQIIYLIKKRNIHMSLNFS